MTIPIAASRVLPTLNEDGSRQWICPKPSYGAFWRTRRLVAWALIALFVAIPHLRVGGRPLVLLDLPRREFSLLGAMFLPTDTLLLMLLLLSVIVAVFLMTALFGRVWCGWACPQTVYMEFVFRPLERWIEGGRGETMRLNRERRFFAPRRLLKYGVYAVLALALAHTFLAYFVGTEQLAVWVRRSPIEHPTSFLVMAGTAALIMFDFTWFREQTCMVACPYGRWQSVLLDRESLIVAYDARRGEPRRSVRARKEASASSAVEPPGGDCIDCNACVATCPTGIDIRDGLQMECIHCTQCADACDTVMRRMRKPTGLIGYTSRAALEGRAPHLLRARTVLYPLAFVVFFAGFVWSVAHREAAEVTVLRGTGAPFTEQAGGTIANQVRIKVANRTTADHLYRIALEGVDGAQVVAPQNPLPVAAGAHETTSLFVMLPASAFTNGERAVTVVVDDGAGFTLRHPWKLAGPTRGGSLVPGTATY
jgi:cytochrome c oxidase accessory protein FixG